MLQLLQPREGAVVERVVRHGDALEDGAKLGGAIRRAVATGEAGEVLADLGERDAIRAVVAAARAKAGGAAREHLRDDVGDLAHPVVLVAGPVDAAGRRIDERRDARFLAAPRQLDRAGVVDREGRARIMLAERIIRELCEMDDRVVAGDVARRDLPDVLVDGAGPDAGVVVEPAASVEPAIEPGDRMPVLEKHRAEDGADIPIRTGNQNPHSSHSAVHSSWRLRIGRPVRAPSGLNSGAPTLPKIATKTSRGFCWFRAFPPPHP